MWLGIMLTSGRQVAAPTGGLQPVYTMLTSGRQVAAPTGGLRLVYTMLTSGRQIAAPTGGLHIAYTAKPEVSRALRVRAWKFIDLAANAA